MKRTIYAFAMLAAFMLISACGKSFNEKRVNIVTSFYPMYIIALNIVNGIDDVSVSNMAENHVGCLHDFQLQSDDMKKLEKANAFIINGAGMESFLDKVVKEIPNIRIIDSSKDIELIKDDDGHGEENNPHIWMSIENYIKQVENISQDLSSLDPKNSSKYQQNADSYIKKLSILKNEMHEKLDGLPNKDIVTFHEAFPYFAKEFGLNIVTVINHEPESEPSAKELADTIEIVKNSGVKSLFVEPQYSDSLAKAISQETGASIYTLDPASSGEISMDAYINAMKKNADVLKQALS